VVDLATRPFTAFLLKDSPDHDGILDFNEYGDQSSADIFNIVDINVQRSIDYAKFKTISPNVGIYFILSNGLLNLTYHKHILMEKRLL
jgi:hypothetical protein